MSELKAALDAELAAILADVKRDDLASRRLYSFNSSPIIAQHKKDAFDILHHVATRFSIPMRSIYVAGSTQVGYSYFKERDFTPGESDLDLAIVDARLFQRYSEAVYRVTKGYTDLTGFSVDNANAFRGYLAKGYLRPDLMPTCAEKTDWFTFFNRLSHGYIRLFKNINCGVFLSEYLFEMKQVALFEKFRGAK